MTEAALTKQVTGWLTANKWKWFKLVGGPRQEAGIPDLVAMKNGRTVWIELKVDQNKLSKLQEWQISDIMAHGVTAFVAWSLKTVKARLGDG